MKNIVEELEKVIEVKIRSYPFYKSIEYKHNRNMLTMKVDENFISINMTYNKYLTVKKIIDKYNENIIFNNLEADKIIKEINKNIENLTLEEFIEAKKLHVYYYKHRFNIQDTYNPAKGYNPSWKSDETMIENIIENFKKFNYYGEIEFTNKTIPDGYGNSTTYIEGIPVDVEQFKNKFREIAKNEFEERIEDFTFKSFVKRYITYRYMLNHENNKNINGIVFKKLDVSKYCKKELVEMFEKCEMNKIA